MNYKFDQAVFITTSDASQVILLSGYTERPSGLSSAVAGTGFAFEEEIWTPIKWEKMYDEIVELENLEIASDGIRMIYIDPYMAEAFYLPSHTGALYKLKRTEDGSFWADYSKYPRYPTNENLPSEELLFKIRKCPCQFKRTDDNIKDIRCLVEMQKGDSLELSFFYVKKIYFFKKCRKSIPETTENSCIDLSVIDIPKVSPHKRTK